MRLSRNTQQQQAGTTVAVLDIGSSKTCCLIAVVTAADAVAADRVVALGLGHQRSMGIVRGMVSDPQAAADAVRAAVSQAERSARIDLDSVYISVGCGNPRSRTFHGQIQIPTGLAGVREVAAIESGARAFAARDGAVPLVINRLAYKLDGTVEVSDPIGMAARALHADHHGVAVDDGPLRNITAVVEAGHLQVAGLVPAALASALAATTERERAEGVTCVDIGAGTTELACFVRGHLVHVSQILLGGQQVTDEVARILSVGLAEAERIKTLYSTLAPIASAENPYSTFPFAGITESGLEAGARAGVAEVARRHYAGLLQQVMAHLSQSGMMHLAGHSIVLAGGASQIPGLAEFASGIVGCRVRASRPGPVRGWAMGVPTAQFACLIGLAVAAAEPERWGMLGSDGGEEPQGYLGRMERWLRDSF